ncbi:LysR family transcriptional regulator [Herbaspirillum lusitanum]|jgi:DNA-binding transcriptional LysR family regulator|uniref:LysR family transcriptional regulator n=1 Tax=Herbaspirillum lusitanum TaxID=213312 RepID=A0ABW9ABC6_9BURK
MKDERLLEMQVFKAVAGHGGFTAAATALGVSQPFVSRTLNHLEKRLGVALLRRSTRQIHLTEEGKTFLVSCNKIIGDIEMAEGQISSTGSSPAGDLRITAATSFGMDQIVPLLPEFLALYPGVRVRLSLSDNLVDIIGNGFDVAIRMGHLQDSMLLSRKLCHLQRLVVAAPSYLARHGTPQTPDDLVRHNCLQWEAPMDHLNHWPFMIDGQRTSVEIHGNFQFTSGMSSVELCLAGVGLTRMAEHFATPAIRQKRLVPLLADFQAQDDTAIYAVYAKERHIHPRVRAFVDYLLEKFKQPPWLK